MTVYARSDLMSVALSPAHGGCGEVHSRPVRDGAPDKVWALTCSGGCEDVLRSDAHWSGHPDDVPETPDERLSRESMERSGKKQRENSTHEAIQELSKLGDLPKAIEQLAKIMTGGALQGQSAPATETCSNGHVVPTGTKFCPECGVSMTPAPVETVTKPATPDTTKTEDDDKSAPDVKPAPAKKAPARKPPASS